MEEVPLKLLIYGQNRVGKTTLACQFPKPLLILSFEPCHSGGLTSVRKVEGVDFLQRGRQIESLNQLVELALELESSKYKTVVLDSVTSLQDWVLADLLNLPNVPDQMSWGTVSSDVYRERSEKTREILRRFVDLPRDTIFLGKERDHNPPREDKVTKSGKVQPDMRPKFLRGTTNESFIATDLGGATVGWIQDVCDWVCRLFIEEEVAQSKYKLNGKTVFVSKPTGKYIRYLRMAYHPNYAAGPRASNPDKVPEVMPNPTAEKILEIVRGN